MADEQPTLPVEETKPSETKPKAFMARQPKTAPEPPKEPEPSPLEVVLSALTKLSVPDLHAVINQAEDLRRERRDEGITALRDKMRQEAEMLGVSLGDLFPQSRLSSRTELTRPPGRKTSSSKGPLPAKFRGPNGEEWSGRGRTPIWVTQAKERGEDMAKYLIKA